MSRSHSETGLRRTVAQKGPPGQLGSPQVWGQKDEGGAVNALSGGGRHRDLDAGYSLPAPYQR